MLVVEDDPRRARLFRRTLEKDGWTVAEADNGRVALEPCRGGRPELILLDLMMPEMDGFEFLDELRRTRSGTRIPVVVVTART